MDDWIKANIFKAWVVNLILVLIISILATNIIIDKRINEKCSLIEQDLKYKVDSISNEKYDTIIVSLENLKTVIYGKDETKR